MREKGKEISELRIRAIAFRDFAVDGNGSVEDTGFLNIPEIKANWVQEENREFCTQKKKGNWV